MIRIMVAILKVDDKPIKIDTEVVKPFLCDYGDAYILVTGEITVQNIAAANNF